MTHSATHGVPITLAWANEFAADWISAWNSGDIDRILAHYADDFEMCSPLIVDRMKEPSGVLRGKKQVRPYWAIGLAQMPSLKFELLAVHLGINDIAIRYLSVGRRYVIEVFHFNEESLVTKSIALYGDPVSAAI